MVSRQDLYHKLNQINILIPELNRIVVDYIDFDYLILAGFESIKTIEDETETYFPASDIGSSTIVISPDHQTLYSGNEDGTITIWGISTKTIINSFRAHPKIINCLAISLDGKKLYSGSQNGLKCWNTITGKEITEFNCNIGGVISIVLSPDGNTLYSKGYYRNITVLNSLTGYRLYDIDPKTYNSSMALNKDGSRLYMGNYSGDISVFDTVNKAFMGDIGTINQINRIKDKIVSLAINQAENILFSGDLYGVVKVWKLNKEQVWSLTNQFDIEDSDGLRDLAINREGTVMYSLGFNGEVKKWDLTNNTSTVIPQTSQENSSLLYIQSSN